MISNKVNIFNTLPQYTSDHEDEDVPTQKTQGKQQGSRNQGDRQRNDDNKQSQRQNQNRQEGQKAQQEVKRDTNQKEIQRTEENNTQKQSNTEKPAQKENKRNEKKEKREERVEGEESQQKEQPKVEEPEGITLQEYYSKQNLAQNQPQVNELKAKITSEQLIKELGNSTLLKSRQTQQVDDRKVGKKKDRLDVNHHAAITTDHADLLGFRTGFIEKEYRQRGTEEAGAPQKRGPRTGGKPERERENAKEEETPATQTETTPVEGEQAAEGTEKTEGKETQNRRREGQGQGQRGGRGGYKGGEGYKGDRPRKDYGNKPAQQTKINFEDESAFPKLG